MLNNYDFKYILKKVIIFLIIFVFLSFTRSCKVHAQTLMLTNSDISFNNTSNVNYYFNLNANSSTDVNIKFSYSGTISYTTLVLDVCSGVPLTNSNNLYRKYAAGSSCPNSCFSNNIVRKDLGTSCKNSNGYSTNSYRVYIPIVKLDYGAGCGQSGCYPSLNDTLTFSNSYSWWTFADINGAYLTDELTDINDDTAINRVNTSISNLQTSLNNAIQNQTQQQHQDSINEQNAINQNTQAQNQTNNILNDDNVSGANSEVDSLLQNNAFNDNSGIQSIINAPLNFINGLTNSCTPIQVTIPYIDTPLTIPCIKQELTNHIPTIVPILSTAINGFIIYRILIDIVYLIKSARNPDDDRIEVLDL